MLRLSRPANVFLTCYCCTKRTPSQNALDLDQDALRVELQYSRAEQFKTAEAFYTQGAFAGSYADLQLKNDPGATSFIPAGTRVVGTSTLGALINGSILEDIEIGEMHFLVRYETSDVQATWSSCRVGALVITGFEDDDGCFMEEGKVVVEQKGTYQYGYDIANGNKNALTLQKLSTNAESEMLLCKNCPHRTFEKFFNYYDVPDYGDRWVMAAFETGRTRYARGNADFSTYGGVGHKQAILFGSAFLNVWMYVIQKMEEALDLCKDGQDGRLNSWDQAVAFYTGSMEGQNGTERGQMIHALADKLCADFKTCGDSGNVVSGRAAATASIFSNFDLGKVGLEALDCAAVEEVKIAIEDKMVVPLVQATLRHAYRREMMGDSEQIQAEGATLAASVLPLVHHCNPDDAEIIYKYMKVGSGIPSFLSVKTTFERNYQCMGISCSDVGGFYDNANNAYFEFAGPCASEQPKLNGTAIGLGVFFGLVALLILGFLVVRYRRKLKQERENPVSLESVNLHPGRAWT